MRAVLGALSLGAGIAAASQAAGCSQILSCSKPNIDPCCVPSPGLFVFKQRFEPDVGGDQGSWGIEGLDVLGCQSKPISSSSTHSPTRTHEQIASICLKSALFGGEEGFNRAEADWAQSEVGEGVEEVWERSWNTAGRHISTMSPECIETSDGEEIAAYFHALHKLQRRFTTAQFLDDADITPSDDTSYSFGEIIEALSKGDNNPVLVCDNMTLSSVHWPLQVKGTFQQGEFHPSELYNLPSKCPPEGIIYPPSPARAAPTPTHTWDPIYRPEPRPITLKSDESKKYYRDGEPDRQDPKRLGVFKTGDEGRLEKKVGGSGRTFARDEL